MRLTQRKIVVDVDIEGLKRNVKWSINYVADKNGPHKFSNKTLAKKLGVNKGTVSNYRTMTNIPKVEFIDKFCKSFNFSINWFLYGRGEPFPGARLKYPEVCGPEEGIPLYNKVDELTGRVAESVTEYSAGVDEFGKAVAGLKEIFDSHDPVLIPAIQANFCMPDKTQETVEIKSIDDIYNFQDRFKQSLDIVISL